MGECIALLWKKASLATIKGAFSQTRDHQQRPSFFLYYVDQLNGSQEL